MSYNIFEALLEYEARIGRKLSLFVLGHPKCLFCEERFYDDELQYKHLRKEHCFCSICDEDGVHNCFYK